MLMGFNQVLFYIEQAKRAHGEKKRSFQHEEGKAFRYFVLCGGRQFEKCVCKNV